MLLKILRMRRKIKREDVSFKVFTIDLSIGA
jgi:hypothetical protein